MGVDSEHPAIGHDLAENIIENRATDPGRAIMQFGGSQAYMKGGRVVILGKGKAAREYSYENQKLVPARQQDDAFKDEALAHSIWSINAYDQGLYQLHEADGLTAHRHSPLSTAAEPEGGSQ